MSKLPILEVPKHTLQLPSTQTIIEYRPYYVKEEKQLYLALESEDADVILRTIRDLCQTCSFNNLDPNKHTEFDLEYFFINLRSRSVGESAHIKLACREGECEHYNDIEVDLTEVNVPDLDKDIHNIELTDTIHVVMKHPAINTLIEFEQQGLENKISDLDYTFAKVALYIDQIHHDNNIFHAADNSLAEIQVFIEQLPSPLFKKINTFFENLPRIQYTAEFDCKKCEKPNKIVVEGYQNFFV